MKRHPDAYGYGESWGPDNPAPGSAWASPNPGEGMDEMDGTQDSIIARDYFRARCEMTRAVWDRACLKYGVLSWIAKRAWAEFEAAERDEHQAGLARATERGSDPDAIAEPKIGRVTRTGSYCTEDGVESGTVSYEPGMVYLPLARATGPMTTCSACFFDDDGVTPCPEHLAELCEGCYKPLGGQPGPCAECARNAW
jgi:hypothetical protein